jgi:dUTP pyrophosphatase
MTIKVKKLRPSAKLPTRAYEAPLGYDLYFCPTDEQPIYLWQGMVPSALQTGIAVEPPEGYGLIIKERSSLGGRGLAIRAGVIDFDYRGELIVQMQYTLGPAPVKIEPGDKIAQFILIPTPTHDIVEVTTLSNTMRDERGFGSSDK